MLECGDINVLKLKNQQHINTSTLQYFNTFQMPRTKNFERSEVLEKAKNLFWKQGFHATSMQNLVDHLGINRASLYGEFGGKKQLYEEALTAYRTEGYEYLKSTLSKRKSAKSALKNLFLDAVISDTQDPDRKGCFVVNCTTEYLPKNTEILSDLLEQKSNFESLISETLQRGVDSEELSNSLNVNELASYFYTFFSGLKIISKVNQDRKELEKTVKIGLQVLD